MDNHTLDSSILDFSKRHKPTQLNEVSPKNLGITWLTPYSQVLASMDKNRDSKNLIYKLIVKEISNILFPPTFAIGHDQIRNP